MLGSGLGEFANRLENATSIAYQEIPHFCKPTVEGHSGNLVLGTLPHESGKPLHIACMQGRFHCYEGHSQQVVTFPIRVAKQLGAHTLLATNAAGGINLAYKPGTLMMICDHINFTGDNPLTGENPCDELKNPYGPRFLDMTSAYDQGLRNHLKAIGSKQGIELQEGVYLGLGGPTYETPAEIRMFRTFGADAVGMSTVPEVIVARHEGLRVTGISCITNAAAGITGEALSHEEVTETANAVKAQFITLLQQFLTTLPKA